MFDIYIGEIELTEVIIFSSVLIMIPLQLFLCFKVRNLLIKLLPIITFLILIISFFCMSQFAEGWDGLGYIILAMFAGILLVACVFAWIIWFVVKRIKKI